MFQTKSRSQAKPVRRAFVAVAISAAAVLSSVGVAAPASAGALDDCAFGVEYCQVSDGWYYFQNNDGTATIHGTYNSFTNLVIPRTIDDLEVTEVGEYAFFNMGLESVTIPDSVHNIWQGAFESNGLTSVTLPSSVTGLGRNVFANNSLTSVTIPSSLTTIRADAFAGNKLTSLTIPESVTSIEDGAFFGNKLTSLTIPDSVTGIGEQAFGYNELTSLKLGASVTWIGGFAFEANKLTSVTVPNSVTQIGERAFFRNSMTSLKLGSSVSTIAKEAFSNNELTSVTIPNSVTDIGERAFSGNSMTSLKLGSSVSTIAKEAFSKNELTTLSFPASVTVLGDDSFVDNPLKSVSFAGNAPTRDASAFTPRTLINNAFCRISITAGTTGWGTTFSRYPVQVGRVKPCKPASSPVIRSIVGKPNGGFRMGFWAPHNDGGNHVEVYQFSTDNGNSWGSFAFPNNDGKLDSETVWFTGERSDTVLTAGTRYAFKIRAWTLAGPGAASKAFTFTAHVLTTSPVIDSITPASGKVFVKVVTPTEGASVITRYGYSIDGGPIVGAGSASTSGSFWIKGLKNGVPASIRVFAATRAGWGAPSEAVLATPKR